MSLTDIQIISGIFSIIFVCLAIIIGFLIMIKYLKHKEPLLLMVGLVWIILSEIWWSSTISFIVALNNGIGLTEIEYFLIGNLFVPLGILIWMKAFTDLRFKRRQKLILIIFTIICVLYYLIFISTIILDVSQIGQMRGPVDGNYTPLALVFLLTGLFTFVITGLIFSHESLKSSSEELILKGKFLTIAFILFGIGAGLDGLKPYLFGPAYLDIVLIINRVILMISAFNFYCGFILPHFIRRLFLKHK